MSNPIITKDTTLSVQIGSSDTPILELMSVSTPDYALGSVESTKLASNAKEFIAGIEEPGKVTFMVRHTDESFAQVTGLRDGVIKSWQVAFSDGNGFQFTGFLNKVAAKADGPEKLLTLECEIIVSDVVSPLS